MKLEGSHITLLDPIAEDVELIYHWENDKAHWLVSNTLKPYTREQILHFIAFDNDLFASQQQRWMIATKEGEKVGCIDLYDHEPRHRRAGIGILIGKEHRSRGFGRDALQVIVAHCFRYFDMHSVHAEILENNITSIAMFEKAGFIYLGTRKDWIWDGEAFLDQRFYQLINKKT